MPTSQPNTDNPNRLLKFSTQGILGDVELTIKVNRHT